MKAKNTKSWSRTEIVNLLLNIERDLKLEGLIINDIKVWPWIRIKLFVFLINNLERDVRVIRQKSSKNLEISKKFRSVLRILSHGFKIMTMRRKEYLFIGSKTYRVLDEGKLMNKFFDPLIINKKLINKSLSVDIDINHGHNFNSGNLLFFPTLKILLKSFRTSPKVGKEVHQILMSIADNIEQSAQLFSNAERINIKDKFGRVLIDEWSKLLINISVWEFIIKRTKPSVIFTLCYYANNVLAANIAASRFKIPTIELQHGPINHLHLAYGSFQNVINCHDSYFLPTAFATWDLSSKKSLEHSLCSKKVYELGHIWLDYNKGKAVDKPNRDRDVITYALQPTNEIGNPFPDYLIKWINQSKDSCIWWFRLHPRQFNEYNSIKETLESLLFDVEWEIEYPSFENLPKVLSKSSCLVTLCSGVISEAALLGVPSLALSDLSKEYYRYELEMKMLYVVSDKEKDLDWDDLYYKFNSEVSIAKLNRKDSFIEFDHILEHIKN